MNTIFEINSLIKDYNLILLELDKENFIKYNRILKIHLMKRLGHKYNLFNDNEFAHYI